MACPATTLASTLPRIRTGTTAGLSRTPLPVGLEGLGADDGDRTRDLNLGKVARYQLRYVHPEKPRGIEPRTSSLPRKCSCRLSYGGELCKLTGLESN